MSQLIVRRANVAWRPLEHPVSLVLVEVRPDVAPPPDVLVLLDVSGSLAGPPCERARATATELVALLPDERSVGLILAASPPALAASIGPLGASRAAVLLGLARNVRRGATTVARACELARLEVERTAGPCAVVLISDLAWSPETIESIAALESSGAAIVIVEATSAFTPPSPARAPHLRVGLEQADPAAIARALAEILRASVAPPRPGSLTIRVEGRAPIAWLARQPLARGEPLVITGGGGREATVALEGGAARLAFAVSGEGEPRGEALLAIEGESDVRAAIDATAERLEDADAIVRAARESA